MYKSVKLDPDQAQHFIQLDLGSDCLQRPYQQTTLVFKELIKVGVVFGKVY